jgi:methyl-accepting chemotaxis protein
MLALASRLARRFHVRTRIIVSFSLLLLLGTVIAVAGISGLVVLGRDSGRLAAAAETSTHGLAASRLVDGLRRVTLRYQMTHDDAATAEFASLAGRARSELQAAGRTELVADLAAFETMFGKDAELGKTLVQQRLQVMIAGDALGVAVNRLMAGAREENQAAGRSAYASNLGYAGDLGTAMLQAREGTWRFIAANDRRRVSIVQSQLDRAGTALDAADKGMVLSGKAALIGGVRDAFVAYRKALSDLTDTMRAIEELTNNSMDPAAAGIADRSDKAVEGLMAETAQTRDAAAAAGHRTIVLCALLAAAALAVGAALASLVASGIVGPLTAVTGAIGRIAEGERGIDVPCHDDEDEIGEIARAVALFQDRLQESEARSREEEAGRAGREARARALEEATEGFQAQAGSLMGALGGSAQGMNDEARQMRDTADSMSSLAAAVAQTAERASANVAVAAEAAEQLSTSILDIGRQADKSLEISRRADEDAKRSDATMQALSSGAAKIGEIVQLINGIAAGIASAVERQSQATAEIARNVEQAAAGAGKILQSVGELRHTAATTGDAAEKVFGTADSLSRHTNSLSEAVDGLLARLGDQTAAA